MKKTKNIHLAGSVVLIIPIGLAYGLYPREILPKLFDLTVRGIDILNILRAIMGLYVGMAIFWIIGIRKPEFWRTATITNIIFMGGLAAGRIISLLFDGVPSVYLAAGSVAELLLAVWGIHNLLRYKK